MKKPTYTFTSTIRQSGEVMLINLPKPLHRTIKEEGEPPYSIEVRIKLLYPKPQKPQNPNQKTLQ